MITGKDVLNLRTLIIIPAYNEAQNIVRVVDNLIQNFPQYDYVVVNDGSHDQTAQICLDHGYCLIDQPINLGLAGAFQTGMKYAMQNHYDAAIQFDGDGQHRPEFIGSMEEKIKEGYDVVIGSRFISAEKPKTLRMFGNNLIETFIHMTTHKTITDPTSGMRMFSRRVIRILATEINYGPEPDTIAHLIRSGAKVCEVQVKMDDRIAGESYLNLSRSIRYMATICISIVFIGWFRQKVDLGKEETLS